MASIDEFLRTHAPDAESLWDALQHQCSVKHLAIAELAAIVELDDEPELWEVLGVVAANAADPLSRAAPDVRARFEAACRRATERIDELLPKITDVDHAFALVQAWTAATGRLRMYDVVTALARNRLSCRCPCCAAELWVLRDGSGVVVRWRAQSVALDGTGARHELAAAWPPQIGVALGPIRCPRCRHVHHLLDAAPAGARIERRGGGEHVIDIDLAMHQLLHARLVEIARTSDAVRLAGAYQLRVTHYHPQRMIHPRTGELLGTPEAFQVEGAAEPALLALVNDQPVPPVIPGDDPRLDVLGSRIFDALIAHDAVSIPGLGTISIRTIEGRDGFTIDGDPIRVPARRSIRFQPDDALAGLMTNGPLSGSSQL